MKSKAAVSYMMENDAFSQWLGIEIVHVEEGEVILKMKVRNEMLNGFHILHGGVAFALADSAMAFAANSHGQLSVVTDAHIQFPNSAKEGNSLIAKAKETHRSRRKGYYEVLIYREDNEMVISKYQGSAYITDKPNPPDSE